MINRCQKIYYTASFEDRDWDFENDTELRGALKVRPFNSVDVPANQLCLWLEKVGVERCHYQLWWWEVSPPAALPKVNSVFKLSDTLTCQIKRVWGGQELYAVLEVVRHRRRLKTMFEVIRCHQR